jgi:hypothetical protein
MIKEHDLVVLKRNLPDKNLEAGDVGVVVACYDTDGFEVEFVNAAGETIAVLTLTGGELRPMGGSEILHVRDLASI